MRKLAALSASILLVMQITAQKAKVEVITSGTKSNLRGLSVVNDNVLWVSGSNGTVGRSNNAGKNWKWMVVSGFEKMEFRDIEAFTASVALIMAAGPGTAYILKTIDGGETWKVVFEDKSPAMFLDAMDFCDSQNGIVIGDAVNGKFFIARTDDTGNTWTIDTQAPTAEAGESLFAASGTNIRLFANGKYVAASGGIRTRLITNTSAKDLPLVSGQESTGAFSLDIFDNGKPKAPGQHIVVVGGDYQKDSSHTKNCAFSTDGGKSWRMPSIPPHGYRSCVEFLAKKNLLACGPNGVDYSDDDGRTWKWISKEGFNTCRIANAGTTVYLAGENGKVGRVLWAER